MSKRVKVKVKPGKVKIKLKSGDEVLPLSNEDLRELLCDAVSSAVPGVPRIAHQSQVSGSVQDSAPEPTDEELGRCP